MTLETVPRYDPEHVARTGDRAVVVGGSMAGLVAARVLADAFETVTVLEKDDYPDEPTPRRGVPQGTHIHALLEAGRATLEDLFPGFGEALLSHGGLLIDGARDVQFYSEGGYLAEGPRRLPVYAASRPLYEHVTRRHLTARDGIELRPGCQVTDYRTDDAGTRVVGVELRGEDGGTTPLDADLVVDATGRTSRTPDWLAEHGYDRPDVDEVRIDVGYSTTAIRRPAEDRRAVIASAEPPHTRGGFVLPVEDGRWLVNVHGVHGDHPPTDPEGFTDFAASLPVPDVHRLLERHPQAWDEIDFYPFPSNRRYYYEELDRFPDGLLVVGDAIASFNPVYAQGMSVAALEALVLHQVLADGSRDGLGVRFFDRVSGVVDNAWTMAVGADVQFPQTTGPSPPGTGLFNRYLSWLFRRAQSDGAVGEALYSVMAMERPVTSLLRPGIVGRALDPRGLGRRDAPGESAMGDSRGTPQDPS